MEKLKKALLEAAKWEEQLTEYERTKITFAEARQCVIDRIFEKFKQDKKQNIENDIFEICKQLPNTEKIVSDLQNLQVTIDKLLLHIKNVEEENIN